MSQPKPYYNIVKNEAAKEATIYIYGAIGGIDWDTYETINTASKFTQEFNDVEKDADTIHIRINSPGGAVFEGQAIYNAIFASKKKIITYNDGICASMAALILLSGDEIHAFKNSLLMIHNSSSYYWGNKKEVEEQLLAAEKIDKALGTAIEDRLGITAEEVEKDYLNYKDNWFTTDEAEALGFYDHIIQKEKAQVPEDIMQLKPKDMVSKYAAMTFTIPKTKSKITNTMSKPNSFPNLVAVLGATLATTDKGSYINDEQKEAIDNRIAADALAIQTANSAKEKAEQDLQAEKDSRQQAIDAEKANTTAALKAMRTAATAAGVENIAENATMEDINTALTAQIAVLNKKPGASHTSGAAEDKDTEGEFDYVDFESSIYSQIKK
ncbi:head maturation protease, ClpP-related [Zunongwangia atlantica]|uniref:ATP-dependent Clp protease proteolytic subunit n=1 Tax=Zunongwangia atlantica 22II14-10F7 TaxID=1185767 RepID=A0A1Y1SYD4_9FLAO|nr:head maturation protease, ClpP-related [Zunongwangia atlantica]ORL43786.1 peptidase S14 ClpP [Zunongwangia atlantica 22II14-10F7]